MIQTQNLEGLAVVDYQITVSDPSKQQSVKDLMTHERSVLKDSLVDGAVYEHMFVTSSPDVLDKLFRSAQNTGTPLFKFRLGMGTPGGKVWLPWQEHCIVQYSGIAQGIGSKSGHSVQVTTQDQFHVLRRVNKTVSHKGTISSMVARIASQNKLESVIESTEGEYLFVQSYADDIAFIQQRLQPRAANKSGFGNYVFYFRDSILHFHTADYQTEVKQIHYYSSPQSKLAFSDHTQQLWDDGVSGSKLYTYDPYEGKSQETGSDPELSLRYSDGSYQLESVGGFATVRKHLSTNRPEEAKIASQTRYENTRHRAFDVVLEMSRTFNIRVGDIVQLIITPETAKSSAWAGLYLVQSLVHTVKRGSLNSVFKLSRGEITRDRTSVTTQSADQSLTPVSEAKGKPVNLAASSQSGSTIGGSKQTSASTFTALADANKAG